MSAGNEFVSVVVPVRNEVEYVRRCLDSVLNQDYPRDKYEVRVVDGMSTDGTRDILKEYQKADARVRVLDNPQKITPVALNIGIRNSKGGVIIRVDGHAEIAEDYISQCIHQLNATGADCVGGSIKTVGYGPIGLAVSEVMSSSVGVGNSLFRVSGEERYVDTLPFGAYRREVFDKIGFFDESLVRDQDEELNYRMVDHELRIFLTPKIRSLYYCRTSLRKLFHQYFGYGLFKPAVLVRHPSRIRLRYLIPPLLVLALLILLTATVLNPFAALPLISLVFVYLVYVLTASVFLSLKNGLSRLPVYPLVLLMIHLGYGLGFITGLIKLAVGVIADG